MFNIRLRECADNGTKKRVIPASEITFTTVNSGAPRATMSVSSLVAGRLKAPFLAAVEYQRAPSARWASPRQDLIMFSQDGSDEIDPGGQMSFTGVGFVPYLLARMYVQGTGTTGVVERTWKDATPGTLLRAIINEAKAWGWGPTVTMDFDGTYDSNGAAWTAADKTSIKWRVGTPCSQVLQQLSEQGLIDWWVEGSKIRVFRSPAGADRAASITLGGTGFESAPRTGSIDEVYTHLTIFTEDHKFVNVANPGADARFGTLWSTMTQGGVTDLVEARKLAEPSMVKSRAVAEQNGFDWEPTATKPMPFVDFNIGDNVSALTRDGIKSQRVLDFVIEKRESQVTVRATLGDKMVSQAVRVAKRTSASSFGQIIVGNGSGFNPGPAPSSPQPEAPTGLRVSSNVGVWAPDGSERSTVSLKWNTVSDSVDGGNISVNEYEVWSRVASGTATLAKRTSAPEATITDWATNVQRFFKVRARSAAGQYGEFTEELSVVPARPVSEYPKAPTDLIVLSNTGEFANDGSSRATITVGWSEVTQSTDNLPITVRGYEVWEGTLEDPGIVLVGTRATSVSFSVPSGAEKALRVRAQGISGVWSDFSAAIPVTAAVPDMIDTIPNPPSLESRLGIVAAAFDGQSTTGPIGNGFQHVVTEISTDEVEWVRVGQPLSGPGAVILNPPVGTEIFVRFLPVDTLGRVGTPSAAASIICAGVTGPDIEANSITANHVLLGTLTASHLEAGIGGELDLWANSAITLLVGQQADTQGQVDALALWLRLDDDGLHMGRTDSPFQTHMREDRFSITENGVETTYWEAGRMVVPLLVAPEADIANHKFEQYSTGTVVKRLG